jgi:hypothetical protein
MTTISTTDDSNQMNEVEFLSIAKNNLSYKKQQQPEL